MEKRERGLVAGLVVVAAGAAGLLGVGCSGAGGGSGDACAAVIEAWEAIDAADAGASKAGAVDELLERNEAVREELRGLDGLVVGDGLVGDYVEAEGEWRDALDAVATGEAKAGSQDEAMEAMLVARGALMLECGVGS